MGWDRVATGGNVSGVLGEGQLHDGSPDWLFLLASIKWIVAAQSLSPRLSDTHGLVATATGQYL